MYFLETFDERRGMRKGGRGEMREHRVRQLAGYTCACGLSLEARWLASSARPKSEPRALCLEAPRS